MYFKIELTKGEGEARNGTSVLLHNLLFVEFDLLRSDNIKWRNWR